MESKASWQNLVSTTLRFSFILRMVCNRLGACFANRFSLGGRCCGIRTRWIGGANPPESAGIEGFLTELGEYHAALSFNIPCAWYAIVWERALLTASHLGRCCGIRTMWIGGANPQESDETEGFLAELG